MSGMKKNAGTIVLISLVLGGAISTETKVSAQSQSLSTQCTGAAIGSLLGLIITGNAQASANAIPSECRQNQNSPSPQLNNRNQELNSDSIMKSTREERYKLETKPERDRIMQRTYPAGNWY